MELDSAIGELGDPPDVSEAVSKNIRIIRVMQRVSLHSSITKIAILFLINATNAMNAYKCQSYPPHCLNVAITILSSDLDVQRPSPSS